MTILTNAAMNIRVQIPLLDIVVSFPLSVYPEVELLDHRIVLFLIFLRPSIIFCLSFSVSPALTHAHTHTQTHSLSHTLLPSETFKSNLLT